MDDNMPERVDTALNNLIRALLSFDVDGIEMAMDEMEKVGTHRDIAMIMVAQARVWFEVHPDELLVARAMFAEDEHETSDH